MKKINTLIVALFLSSISFAQVPEKMSYQAVVRDAGGELISDQSVGMRISILQTSINGTSVYVETHAVTSNANGLVSIEIGSGTVSSGDISTVNWANGPFFIQSETDPTGGESYVITGTSQLLSVPYALHAKVAESVESPVYTIGYSPELGGYVFMISADGKHGLVCETVDQGFSTWYNAQNFIANPTNHSTDGQNFTDWRLPTRYELAQMYSLKTEIESIGDSFGAATYWTSTQSPGDYNAGMSGMPYLETAWRQNFGSGNQFNSYTYTLNDPFFVRSVREF